MTPTDTAMMRFLTAFAVALTAITSAFGQKADDILEEGKLLYRLERASWYGTDVFVEQFSHKMDAVGGYLSYIDESDRVINIFFDKGDPVRILARLEFESLPSTNPTLIDSLNHDATSKEIDLIAIRQDAVRQISEIEDGFFSFYDNASFNPIPLIHKGKRKVYLVTGPNVSDVVLLGNDYLLEYNRKNKLVKKEKLHNSLIELAYRSGDPENGIKSTMHSHVLSDLITPTDICTLLLYKDFVEWKQHYVIGRKYVSIFDLEDESLTVMKREAWEKIFRDQNNQ